MKRVLITGATGFIGSALARKLSNQQGFVVTAGVREKVPGTLNKQLIIGDLGANFCILESLEHQDTIIHTAGVAHNRSRNYLSDIEKVNTLGTLRLARQAAECGVKRFIYISSINVHGNFSSRPILESEPINPSDNNALSKWRAEKGLWEIQRSTDMEVVIIRPPLIYGPKAPGNFATLTKWVKRGIPLPLGLINNKRSYVGVDNLIDFIITCINHPMAANETFLVADGEDISTSDLLRKVAHAMGKPSRLVPVSEKLLMFGAAVIGKRDMARSLLCSLQINMSKASQILGWHPPISLDEGLCRCFIQGDKCEAD